MKERKQDNLQLVPHILIIHLEVVLQIGEVPADLHAGSRAIKYDLETL